MLNKVQHTMVGYHFGMSDYYRGLCGGIMEVSIFDCENHVRVKELRTGETGITTGKWSNHGELIEVRFDKTGEHKYIKNFFLENITRSIQLDQKAWK